MQDINRNEWDWQSCQVLPLHNMVCDLGPWKCFNSRSPKERKTLFFWRWYIKPQFLLYNIRKPWTWSKYWFYDNDLFPLSQQRFTSHRLYMTHLSSLSRDNHSLILFFLSPCIWYPLWCKIYNHLTSVMYLLHYYLLLRIYDLLCILLNSEELTQLTAALNSTASLPVSNRPCVHKSSLIFSTCVFHKWTLFLLHNNYFIKQSR